MFRDCNALVKCIPYIVFLIRIYIRRTVYLTFHEDSRTTAIGTSVIPYSVRCCNVHIFLSAVSLHHAVHTVCTTLFIHENVFVVPSTLLRTHVLLTANLHLHYDVRLAEAVDDVSNGDKWWELSKLYWAARRKMGDTPLTGGG